MALFSEWKDKQAEKARNMRGVLLSARRYVQSYAANENNHPQARDIARDLLGQIDGVL